MLLPDNLPSSVVLITVDLSKTYSNQGHSPEFGSGFAALLLKIAGWASFHD
jgi:hypothetical protein